MKQIIEENTSEVVKTSEKKHIGNLKLSESGKAVKFHIFSPELFLVIPLNELTISTVGKVYQYVDGESEIIGEIQVPKNGKKNYVLTVKGQYYYLKKTYIDLLLNGSKLVLNIMEE